MMLVALAIGQLAAFALWRRRATAVEPLGLSVGASIPRIPADWQASGCRLIVATTADCAATRSLLLDSSLTTGRLQLLKPSVVLAGPESWPDQWPRTLPVWRDTRLDADERWGLSATPLLYIVDGQARVVWWGLVGTTVPRTDTIPACANGT